MEREEEEEEEEGSQPTAALPQMGGEPLPTQ